MDRIHHPSAEAVPPPVDSHPTPGYPSEGNPQAGVEATILTAYTGHMLIEEIRSAVLALGLTADKADLTQLRQALLRAAGGNVSVVSADTTLTADHAGLVEIAISANRTITLPAAAAAGGKPLRFTFVRTDTTASTATVQRAGADTIEGGTSITVPVGGRVTLISDGVSAWRALSGVGGSRMQTITATTNFTVPAGVYRIKAIVTGGSGGGAGCGTGNAGNGGGAGGTAIGWYDVTPGQVLVATIGAGGTAGASGGGVGGNGGTSSLGALCSATGGVGGTVGAGASGGGVGSGGSINLNGGDGAEGAGLASSAFGGIGGSSFWGGGGRAGAGGAGGGLVGKAYGSGGGGSYGSPGTGGAGKAGVIVVEW